MTMISDVEISKLEISKLEISKLVVGCFSHEFEVKFKDFFHMLFLLSSFIMMQNGILQFYEVKIHTIFKLNDTCQPAFTNLSMFFMSTVIHLILLNESKK